MTKLKDSRATPDRLHAGVKSAAVRVQYGALPYRADKAGAIQILLVTTRRNGRWIIPKGWPIKGLTPKETAAREAYEEAGARGDMKRRSVGTYSYDKLLDDKGITVPCEVKVFPLRVRRLEKVWPEQRQRIVKWFELIEAVEAVTEPGLKALIELFATKPTV
jgi:8-oxo-dGTP pyrophosphatase MutT (NUDIX family)